VTFVRKNGEEIAIEIGPGGTFNLEWWDEEIGDLVCSLCAKGPGWKAGIFTSGEEDAEAWTNSECLRCANGNPFCG